MKLLRHYSIISLLIFAACSKTVTSTGQLFRIPWPDSKHEYSMQDVVVESFNEPQFLRGDFAEIFIQPELRFDLGTLAQPGTPSGRFVTTQTGVMLALDAASIQAATLYAHLERLRKFDVLVGAAPFLPTRQLVGINVGIIDSEKHLIENNAQYNPIVDALLFVPYTESELPIIFNAGVIAHEHFHSIFQKIVLSEFNVKKSYLNAKIEEPTTLPILNDEPSEKVSTKLNSSISIDQYNRFVLRGINEGLADYWGWLYSGDENFVGRSLPIAVELRRLKRSNLQFYTQDYFKNRLSKDVDDRVRMARAYSLGTQYAVYFYNLSVNLFDGAIDEVARRKMAHILVMALPELKMNLSLKLESEYLAPEIFVHSFLKAIKAYSDAPGAKNLDLCKSLHEIAPLSVDRCVENGKHEK